MLKESVTIDDVVELLNDAFSKDPEAMNELVKARVTCNEKLAYHPTIQVGQFGEEYKVGIIGILNGIFGTAEDGYGSIAGDFDIACHDGDELHERVASKLTGFKRIR